MIDATYVKAREAIAIQSVAVILVVAVNTEGQCQVIGMKTGPNKAETFWTGFLHRLMRRGLRGMKLAISDAHEGLKAAAAKVLKATWKRCRVHFMRTDLAYANKDPAPLSARPSSRCSPTSCAQDVQQQWRIADQ